MAYPLECNPRIHSQACVFAAETGDQRKYGELLVLDEVVSKAPLYCSLLAILLLLFAM